MHSATKYLGGHNDLLAGAVLGSAELVDGIRSLQAVTGAIIDPLAAYLLVRGLKTFALRVARQNANAQALAEFLEAHPRIARCIMRGCLHIPITMSRGARCAALAVWFLSSSRRPRRHFAGSRCVRIPQIAPSLGGVESLIEQPALMSFYELTTEERIMVGIKDN